MLCAPPPIVVPPTESVVVVAVLRPNPTGLWTVVNKHRPLTSAYVPADLVAAAVPHTNPPYLRREAASAAERLFAALTAETGLTLQAVSAYRSYATQASVHAQWVSTLGQHSTDLTSARPGYSEHQLGLALDVDGLPATGCTLQPCWADTPHSHWLADNAWRFGFIVRYPDHAESSTGYEFEPYHLRYVGPELAALVRNGTTLEAFFGLEPAPDYLPTRRPSL